MKNRPRGAEGLRARRKLDDVKKVVLVMQDEDVNVRRGEGGQVARHHRSQVRAGAVVRAARVVTVPTECGDDIHLCNHLDL